MAQQLLEYRVVVDSSTGIASIQALDKAIKETDASTNQLSQSAEKVSKNLGQAASKAGLAGAAVVEIGRTISDANYGFTAMANNISQLGTLFTTLVATTGGVAQGFAALRTAFMGPLGIIVGFQILVAIIERFSMNSKKASEETKQLKTTTDALTSSVKSLADEEERRVKIAKQLTAQQAQDLINQAVLLEGLIAVTQQNVDASKAAEEINKAYDSLPKKTGIAERAAKLLNKEVKQTQKDVSALIDTSTDEKKIELWQAQLDKINKILKEGFGTTEADRPKEVKINPITGQDIDEERRSINKLYEDLIQKVRSGDFKTPLQEFAESQLKISAEADEKGLNQLNDRLQKEQQLLEDSRKKKKEISEEEKEHALLMYDAIGGGLQALSDIAGKETAAGKAFAVAGALIDTYAAIAGQLRAAQKSPGAAIPGYAIAQAIATGLFGFAQVKKILSVQVPGGGGGGGSAGSMAPAPSPTFNVVGSSGSSQLREAVEKGMEKPVKAYVTQKDINSSAELDRNTRKSATIV